MFKIHLFYINLEIQVLLIFRLIFPDKTKLVLQAGLFVGVTIRLDRHIDELESKI